MVELTTVNLQPAEKPDWREDGTLEVVHVWKTLQGEGPHAGRVAVFVRLSGCDLCCPACDTDYTSVRQEYKPDALAYLVDRTRGGTGGLVVITGGEPFRQNVGPLCRLFLEHQCLDVQVETNGTLYLPKFPYGHFGLSIVCSPKTGQVNPRLKPHITHLKYVVEAGKVDPHDGLPTDSLGCGVRVARPWPGLDEVFVQPLDEGDPERNRQHAAAAVASCLKHGYRLSLQVHKLLGLE